MAYEIVAWPMAVFIGLTTSIMAFFGGFAAYYFTGMTLKLVFATMLVVAGFLILFSVTERKRVSHERIGYWQFKSGNETIVVSLWLAVPFGLGSGFIAGMVGVSGGSFLIPLMVLGCGMPMKTAVGTAAVFMYIKDSTAKMA